MMKETIEVLISTDTFKETTNTKFDVDVYEPEGERLEHLTVVDFPSREKAETYISSLEERYEVTRLD